MEIEHCQETLSWGISIENIQIIIIIINKIITVWFFSFTEKNSYVLSSIQKAPTSKWGKFVGGGGIKKFISYGQETFIK